MRNNSTWAPSALSPIPWPKGAWNPWLILATSGGLIVLNLVPALGYVSYYNLARHVRHGAAPSLPPTFQLVLLQMVTYVPIVIFFAIVLPKLSHVSLAALGIRRPTGRDIGAGLVGTIAMWLVVVISSQVVAALTHRHDTETAVAMLKELKSTLAIATFFLLACVCAPIVEELTFRVFVFGALTRYAPISVSAIVSGILFGLVHAGSASQLLTISVPLALGGVVLAYVYATSRCFWSNVVTHACFNAINTVALVFFHAS